MFDFIASSLDLIQAAHGNVLSTALLFKELADRVPPEDDSVVNIALAKVTLKALLDPAPTPAPAPATVAAITAAASTAAPPSASGGTCAGQTKAGKQCSLKGPYKGSDEHGYCMRHFKELFPGVELPAKEGVKPKVTGASAAKSTPPAKGSAAKSSAVKTPTVKATVSSGSGAIAQPCDHDIKGPNARKCGKNSKGQAPDGRWFCTTHLKSHSADKAGKAAASDAAVAAKLAAHAGYETPTELLLDDEIGLAKDINGMCYVADWAAQGPSVVGRLVSGVLEELTEEDLRFCEDAALLLVPAPDRTRIIALPVAERAKLMEEGDATAGSAPMDVPAVVAPVEPAAEE